MLAEIFNPMVQTVADLPFPTIAAVQGACLGTGLGLALACDVVLAADTAKFGSPFAQNRCRPWTPAPTRPSSSGWVQPWRSI